MLCLCLMVGRNTCGQAFKLITQKSIQLIILCLVLSIGISQQNYQEGGESFLAFANLHSLTNHLIILKLLDLLKIPVFLFCRMPTRRMNERSMPAYLVT